MDDSSVSSPSDQGSSAIESTPLAHRIVRGGLWAAASSYWTIGVGFAATVVMTRLLEPEAFGTFALASFFAQLLRLQPKLALAYPYAQYQDRSDEVLGTYVIMDLIAALSGLLIVLLAVPVLLAFGYDIVVVQISVFLALAAVMEGTAGIGSVLLDKELHFAQTSLVQSLAFPLSYVPALWLATHSGGVWSLVALTATYNALSLVGIWWVVRRRLPHVWRVRWQFSPALARRFLRFGITIGLGGMAGMLLTQLDNFLIGSVAGVTMLGYYDRAYRTAQWPATLLTGVLSRTTFYTYAQLQNDAVRLQKTVSMVMWVITSLAFPLALAIFVTAPDLLVLLYGERWLPSAPFLRILVLISVVRPLWDQAGTLFVAIGKPGLPTRLSLVQAAILLAAGWPMTIAWGAIGTCAAVALSLAVGMVIIYHYTTREVSIRLWSTLGVPFGVGALTLLGYFALNRLVDLNGLTGSMLVGRVALKSLYAVVAFLALSFLVERSGTLARVRYVWRLAVRADR